MSNILDFVPAGYTLRAEQRQALLDTEACWDYSDVVVVPGDVGFGKSLVAMVIARWRAALGESTAVITPRVMLQDQYAESFPEVPVLKGRARYCCVEKRFKSCEERAELKGNYCAACPYVATRVAAKESQVAVLNFQSYLHNSIYKQNLIIDEAHNTTDALAEAYTLNVWKHKEDYPSSIQTHGDVAMWLEKRIDELRREVKEHRAANTHSKAVKIGNKLRRYQQVIDGLVKAPTNFFIEHAKGVYRGKKMDVLRVRPITVKYVPHRMWPSSLVQKIVLMSATISGLDVIRLGLASRRVKYLECGSPIPPDRRPFVVDPTADMSYRQQERSVPKIARRILELAEKHAGEKGIIHVPYALAGKLKPFLEGPRFLWHTKDTKDKVYAQFRESDGDLILVACGMAEGIDLAQEYGRWQVIAKIMYPSLADALVKKQLRDDPDWYMWQAVRVIKQQTGRICRGPDDYGVTYMLDSGFTNFFSRTRKMWSPAFVAAMVGVKK